MANSKNGIMAVETSMFRGLAIADFVIIPSIAVVGHHLPPIRS
jgi:hypothetical protein